MKRIHRKTALAHLIAVALLSPVAVSAASAAIDVDETVNIGVDDGSGNTQGTLSHAIAAVNGGKSSGIRFDLPDATHYPGSVTLPVLSATASVSSLRPVYLDSALSATAYVVFDGVGSLYLKGAQLLGGIGVDFAAEKGPDTHLELDTSSLIEGRQGVPAVALSNGSSLFSAGRIRGFDLGGGNYGDAITLSGGGNVLRLLAGSAIFGNVVSLASSSDTVDALQVGGEGNLTFDLARMGAVGGSAQFQGFSRLDTYGNGVVTLAGHSASVREFNVLAGTLASDAQSLAGTVRLADNATLRLTQATDDVMDDWALITGGSMVKSGAGTLTLSSTGDASASAPMRIGTTSLAQGRLVIGDGIHVAPQLVGFSPVVAAGLPTLPGTVGIIASPGTGIVNRGTVKGGAGAHGVYAAPGTEGARGGDAITGAGYSLVNSGQIVGGDGGYGFDIKGEDGGSAGYGVVGATSIVNNVGGVIAGGQGARGGHTLGTPETTSVGGTAIDVANATIENSGAIRGGGGGYAANVGNLHLRDTGGTGGFGIRAHDSTIHNAVGGTIDGGMAGGGDSGAEYRGRGGFGIEATGNTHIVNDGTISGGPLQLPFGYVPYDDAIHLSGGGNTLELHAGSYVGKVVSTSGNVGGDTLILGSAADTADTQRSYLKISDFTGFATFRKIGGSTWVLTDRGQIAGKGIIEGGTLLIGDANNFAVGMRADITVASGASLGGTGSLSGNVTLEGGATLLPGFMFSGTLTMQCDLSLVTGTRLVFAFAGAETAPVHHALEVVGKADVHGELAMEMTAGAYRMGERYTVVNATQGVQGQFETVTLSPGYSRYVDAVVAYAPSSVSIAFAPTAAAYNDHAASYANTVSAALDSTFQTILGDIDTDPGERREDARSGVWAQGVHNEGTLGGDDQSVHGGAVGGGVAVGEASVLGIAVAGANTETTSNLDRVKVKPLGAFGYGVFNSGAWRLAASVGGGHLKQTTTRRLSDVGLSTSADSTGRFYGAAARLDYRWTPDRFAIAPFVQASYLNSRYGKAGEDGAGMLDLSYGKLTQKLTRYEGGMRVSASFGETTSFVPWLQVGAVGWSGDRRAAVDETIGGFTQRVRGTGLPSSATAASAGVNLVSGAWRFGLAYKGTFGDDYHAHGGSATAEYHW